MNKEDFYQELGKIEYMATANEYANDVDSKIIKNWKRGSHTGNVWSMLPFPGDTIEKLGLDRSRLGINVFFSNHRNIKQMVYNIMDAVPIRGRLGV